MMKKCFTFLIPVFITVLFMPAILRAQTSDDSTYIRRIRAVSRMDDLVSPVSYTDSLGKVTYLSPPLFTPDSISRKFYVDGHYLPVLLRFDTEDGLSSFVSRIEEGLSPYSRFTIVDRRSLALLIVPSDVFKLTSEPDIRQIELIGLTEERLLESEVPEDGEPSVDVRRQKDYLSR